MMPLSEFSARFDAAYNQQLYRRFCTDEDHQDYLERFLRSEESTDLAAEAEDRYKSDRPFDESEPF